MLLRNLSVSGDLDKVTIFVTIDSIKCYCGDTGNGLRNHCGGTKKTTQFAAVHVSGLCKSLNTYLKAAVWRVEYAM